MASGHFMAGGMFSKFGTSHHVAADLLVLGATLVLLIALVSRLRLDLKQSRLQPSSKPICSRSCVAPAGPI